jgi:hypothetical protein
LNKNDKAAGNRAAFFCTALAGKIIHHYSKTCHLGGGVLLLLLIFEKRWLSQPLGFAGIVACSVD